MTFVHIRYAAIAKGVVQVQKVMRAEKIDFFDLYQSAARKIV
jgi:hypothetical protein